MALSREQLRRTASAVNETSPGTFPDLASVTEAQLNEFAEKNPKIAQTIENKLLREDLANSGPAVAKARDYINANRDAFNQELEAATHLPNGAPATPEIKAQLKISNPLPAGNIKLHDPAFIKALGNFIAIRGPGQDGFKDLEPLMITITAYSSIYNTLGDDAKPSTDPVEMQEQAALLRFKAAIKALDKANGPFGDLPNFDPKVKPFDPTDPAFIKSWAPIAQYINNPEKLLDQDQLKDELKDKLKQQTLFDKKMLLLAGGTRPTTQQQQQLNDLALIHNTYAILLPPKTRDEIAKASKVAVNGNDPVDITTLFAERTRQAILEIETKLSRKLDNTGKFVREPDNYLDYDTREYAADVLYAAFKKYGAEYANGRKKMAGSKEKTVYTFDDKGAIYTARTDSKGEALRNTDDIILKDKKVGHILDGIDEDDDRYLLPLQEATVKLMKQISREVRDRRESKNFQVLSPEDLEKVEKKQNDEIKTFFSSNPDLAKLEEEFRLTLKREYALGLDPFKDSDLGKRIRAEEDDDIKYNTFMAAIFSDYQSILNTKAAGLSPVQTEGDEFGGVYNLLSALFSDNTYKSQNILKLREDYGYDADNILSVGAYGILEGMSGGDYIPIEMLYDSDNEEQKNAIRNHFKDEDGKVYDRVTREEVYAFVRQQFDLRAIKELGGKEPAPGQDLNEFIKQNHQTLRQVTEAMYEGKFNVFGKTGEDDPYARDYEIATTKAFARPDITDLLVLSTIRNLRQTTGTIPENVAELNAISADIRKTLAMAPTTHYALKKMRDDELIALTGEKDFNDQDLAQKMETLTGILAKDPGDFISGLDKEGEKFKAYNRMTLNYYEDNHLMANFNYNRSGDVADQTMDTENGRYGAPTQDMLMHMYTRYYAWELKGIYGVDDASIFMNESRTEIQHDITYVEAMSRLTPENQEKLKAGIESLSHPSGHLYYNLRPDFLFQQRLKYLKRQADAKIKIAADAKTKADADAKTKAKAKKKEGPNKDGNDQEKAINNPDDEALNATYAQAAAIAVPPAIAAGSKMANKGHAIAAEAAKLAPFKEKIPANKQHAAKRIWNVLKTADQADPKSEYYEKAIKTANKLLKKAGLTEAQVRVLGASSEKYIIADSKTKAAERALRALEIAENSTKGSERHTRALKLMHEVLKRTGITETQLKLFSLAKTDPFFAALMQPAKTALIPHESFGRSARPNLKDASPDIRRVIGGLRASVDPYSTQAARESAARVAADIMRDGGVTKADLLKYISEEELESVLKTEKPIVTPTPETKKPVAETAPVKEKPANTAAPAEKSKPPKAAVKKSAKLAEIDRLIAADNKAGHDGAKSAALRDEGEFVTKSLEDIKKQQTAPKTPPNQTINIKTGDNSPVAFNIGDDNKISIDNTTGQNPEVKTEGAPKPETEGTTTKAPTEAETSKAVVKTEGPAANADPEVKPAANAEPEVKAAAKASDAPESAPGTGKGWQIAGKTMMGAGVAYSGYHAISRFEEDGEGAFTARAGITGVDTAVAANAWKGTPGILGKTLLKGGGAPLIVLTSAVEVGVAISNKDGQAAGAAATIAEFATVGAIGGAAAGTTLTPLGTMVVGIAGGLGGAAVGVAVVAKTEIDNWQGRFIDNLTYDGSWFGQGMIKDTEDLLKKAAEYKTKLDQGGISQAELSQYNELLREMEDLAIDLQKAEAGLIHNVASWNNLDTDGDELLSDAELAKDETANADNNRLKDNRKLRRDLTQALSASNDKQRYVQLDALFNGVNTADELTARLNGDFKHVAKGLSTTSPKWADAMWWDNQDDWHKTLNDIDKKIVAETTSGTFNRSSFSQEETIELKRDLHNIREKVEDRIHNLLYDADQGDIDAEEFDELNLLREDLKSVDQLENVLWTDKTNNTPAPTSGTPSPGGS